MRIIIDISEQELAAIKKLTRLDDEAEAVVKAAREFVRMTAVRELKAAPGKVDFELNWQELEELEEREHQPPQ